jgi:hypothetical protein
MAMGVLCFVGSNDMHCDFYGLLFQKEEVVLRIIVELIPTLLLTREGLVEYDDQLLFF